MNKHKKLIQLHPKQSCRLVLENCGAPKVYADLAQDLRVSHILYHTAFPPYSTQINTQFTRVTVYTKSIRHLARKRRSGITRLFDRNDMDLNAD